MCRGPREGWLLGRERVPRGGDTQALPGTRSEHGRGTHMPAQNRCAGVRIQAVCSQRGPRAAGRSQAERQKDRAIHRGLASRFPRSQQRSRQESKHVPEQTPEFQVRKDHRSHHGQISH